MASLIPQNIPVQTSSTIASYSYTDIAEGTGVQEFYLISEYSGGATDYLLTTISAKCSNYAAGADKTVTLANGTSVDFDLGAFNMPKKIKGTAYMSWVAINPSSDSFALKFQLIRVRDGTETTISSQITSQVVKTTINGTFGFTKIPITTIYHFKKGDILRLTVENTINNAEAIYLGINPTDEAVTAPAAMSNSKSSVYIPFLLNL